MNSRSALIATTSIFALIGVAALAVILFGSLRPSASAGASLPRIDVSELSEGSYLVQKESYGTNVSAELIVLRDYDANLYIYRVLRTEHGIQMPDLDWDRWGGSCETFEPETLGNALVPRGKITCHDEALAEWGAREWNWSYSGRNLGEHTGDMEQLAYVLEGKYAVVGKHDS